LDSLTRLTPQEIETIKANKPILLEAEQLVKVPWQMLAAVWYREHSLTMGLNPFQFDPPPTHSEIVGLLQSYTDYKPTRYSIDDFPFAAILCACKLRSKCRYPLVVVQSFETLTPRPLKPIPVDEETGENILTDDVGLDSKSVQVITVNKSDEAVADAFYGYNGRAYGSNPFNSPYVANELDELHHNMHFRGETNGQWIDIIDQRPGAFVVYKQLIQEAV
jgi:hypothetical protein